MTYKISFNMCNLDIDEDSIVKGLDGDVLNKVSSSTFKHKDYQTMNTP